MYAKGARKTGVQALGEADQGRTWGPSSKGVQAGGHDHVAQFYRSKTGVRERKSSDCRVLEIRIGSLKDKNGRFLNPCQPEVVKCQAFPKVLV